LWIHIIEGNQNLRALLAWHLSQAGYQVRQSPNLQHAYQICDRPKGRVPWDDRLSPDLVAIDSDLPDGEGIEFCEWIRSRGYPPILMLSARVREVDVVNALQAGADDYLKKPFGLPEFLARVEALLRRNRQMINPETSVNKITTEFTYGDLHIDLVRRQVKIDRQEIDLTPQEFSLLCVLAQAQGEAVHRQELLRRAWDSSVDNPRTIDSHILSLRKKLDRPNSILTVRKVGYRLNCIDS
jgi:two-component system OmpR family response regulator